MPEGHGHGAWELRVLGVPALRGPDGQERRVAGKALALLAYLALEGPVPRSQLAGLLWPDTVEATARNNLVHQLRRLRAALGAGVVVPGDVLSLAPDVVMDVGNGDGTGELLAGVAWPDLPELHDWLLARRARLDAERAARWRADAQRLEDAGEWAGALAAVGRLRAVDPLSEDALRREMRLHYLLGDPARALRVYAAGREELRAALGHDLLPETQALARDIGRGTVGSAPGRAPAPLAQRVGRPPLVGREAEWVQMEAAWAAGQGIVLLGEPGVGKTRLALDFLDAHGGGMRFRGCVGDAGLPYATHARTYRQVLDAFPALDVAPWVYAELARIVPALGQAPAPITDEEHKRRFWQAKAEALGAAVAQGLRRMVFDDVQFMDDASVEAGAYVFAHLGWGQPDAPYRTIHCARPGGLNPAQQGVLHAMLGSGLIRVIELGPLDQGAVSELVAALDLPAAGDLAGELGRYTGGNPLLLLEAARSLHGTAGAAPGRGEPLPLPESAGRVTAARVARLSPAALHAARAAAVLGSDFDVDLVAEVLGAPLLDTVAAWEELEGAQVMRGAGFEHDLVADAVLAAMPGAVRRLLHRSAARALAAHHAPPARIARHWHAGGDVREAAPQYARAAEHARDAYRFGEAAQYARDAADAYVQAGQPDRAGPLWAQADVPPA
ncbi:DNA-binding SARP family transcriptional activator [Deinococcus metalli]|uniref:DNA-binding SARP family transcriptional activator n=1 Tax=Deinococcus metalli TaxID=1141878 RepID=A0A7W8NNE7_9DEIO|nr:AAA family ATPase [Deinococcus metalli]MBB5376819.1 DNA-binding SARP family transcriptional activator [Deinococcus metalli]GHF45589.1 hypothetical protein GCM10017781_22480 [Deinococcus metalli]